MSEQHITTSKKLIRNTVFHVMAQVIEAAVSFFLIRFFLGQLGEERYGVWLLIGSVFRYRGMLGMGLNSAINKYIPAYLAKNDDEGVQRVISTSLFFFSALLVVLVLVSLVVYYNINSWFVIKPDLVATAGRLVLVVGFCFSAAMPLQLSSAVLCGLQRYDILSLSLVVPTVLRTVLLVVLLTRGYGLLTMGLIFGISEIAMRVLQFFFAKKLLPQVSISFKSIDFKLFREMLVYGTNTFLYGIGALIICRASDLIIGIFLGTAEISQFAIAAAGVLLLSLLLKAFTAAIMPAVSDLDARGDELRVKEISFLTQKYSLLMIIPSGCFLVVMGRGFLGVWVGGEFQDPTVVDTMGTILAILSVGHCLRLAQQSNFLVLVGRGQHKIFGVFTALMALLCILASIVSVKVFSWGLLGIAWSHSLPMVLISGLLLPIYFNWKMHISVLESVHRVWWPALLGSLPAVAMIILWRYVAAPDSWLEIMGVVIMAGVLTLVSSWAFSLSKLERKRFQTVLLCRAKK